MNVPSKRALELQTAAAAAAAGSTLTRTAVEIGGVIDERLSTAQSFSSAPTAGAGGDDSAVSAAGTAAPVYIVVTATITPTPSPTPNPYGTLHMTASALWHAFTVTPELATMWAKPLYDMASGDCFKNCGFVTATPRPLLYNP